MSFFPKLKRCITAKVKELIRPLPDKSSIKQPKKRDLCQASIQRNWLSFK